MKKRFFKTRINARIRYLNRQIAIYYAKNRANRKELQSKTKKDSILSVQSPYNQNKKSKIQREKKLSTYVLFLLIKVLLMKINEDI